MMGPSFSYRRNMDIETKTSWLFVAMWVLVVGLSAYTLYVIFY